MQKFRPINKNVHVKLVDDGERKTESGLTVYDKQAVRVTKAEVVAVGARVTTVKPGEIVLLPRHMNLEAGDVREMVLDEVDIEAVVEGS
jgi:co-chaperonin GroES (HSP10)